MDKILFVCTGNTCRSPMAEGIYNNTVKQGASSAGIYANPGEKPSSGAVRALKELYEIDISEHRARRVDRSLIEGADIILALTEEHKNYLTEAFPAHSEKIYTLGETIPDPFGSSFEEYLNCAKKIYKLVNKISRRSFL